MSEQDRSFEQSPVWRKLTDLEIKVNKLDTKMENLPLALRISLESVYVTRKDVESKLTEQCEKCEKKFLTLDKAPIVWSERYTMEKEKQYKGGSKLISIAKGIGWVLTSIASGILSLYVFVEKCVK